MVLISSRGNIDVVQKASYPNTAGFLHFELGIWFREKGKGFFFPLFPTTRQVLPPILFLSGASGVDKTAIVTALQACNTIPSRVFLHTDSNLQKC
ncbi:MULTISPECIES: hypothetical protein [Nostoc]|uniref:Uncharacterized protein n=1 Tax=Nostoc paludosum FACHB-159 TaxID=2692908 RepID=A0ABR8KHG5_9NOSO|nr:MULTISPECIES: hypothetical protein [Nostoc]MBD2681267.1 hypothetical protein [Nostoc sp. FACHB-857]MBD2737745.1 hypothetical protein [Nostoc paludosum FACHB-159]